MEIILHPDSPRVPGIIPGSFQDYFSSILGHRSKCSIAVHNSGFKNIGILLYELEDSKKLNNGSFFFSM